MKVSKKMKYRRSRSSARVSRGRWSCDNRAWSYTTIRSKVSSRCYTNKSYAFSLSGYPSLRSSYTY